MAFLRSVFMAGTGSRPYMRSVLMTVGALFLLGLYSCQDMGQKPQAKPYGDTVTIGIFSKPTIINPVLTIESISAPLVEIIFDGLIRVNEKGEIRPHLASSWEGSKDGLRWTFHIRKGVRFHDGEELTAEDVKFTYDQIRSHRYKGIFSDNFRLIKDIEVKDRYTVEITLNKPSPSFLYSLRVGILPEHLLEGKDLNRADFNYHPIGTGPFRLIKWSEDEIALRANEGYFQGRPYLDGVKVNVYGSQKIVWAKMMSGEVDLVLNIYPRDYEIMEQIPSFKVYSYLNPYCYIVAFNMNNRYFRDQRVRKALNYATDKEEIIRRVLKGRGRMAEGTVYPLSWAYNPSCRVYPYDPKKALQLLKEAGWEDNNGNHILDKDGEEFEFSIYLNQGDDTAERSALYIQQQLLDIGIQTRVVKLPISTYSEYLYKKKFEVGFLDLVSREELDHNYTFWHSSQINGGFNVFSYRNPRIDRLLEEARVALDREKRKQIYYQFQEEMRKDPPGIFLFWRDYLVGVHERFQGVRIIPGNPLGSISEWYVPKEEQKYDSTFTFPSEGRG